MTKVVKEKEDNTQASIETEQLLILSSHKILSHLKTTESGLSTQEAKERLLTNGYNEIASKKKRVIILEFLSRFKNPMIIILLVAGLLSGILGEIVDTIIIFAIVLLSVILDFYQESKAEKAAEMLKEKITTTTTVLRDGIKKEIKLSEVVPGDIVFLSAGDIIPADAAVINARNLFINQSSLTGESFPVEKTISSLKNKGSVLTEWHNCLFMGTSVVSGTGIAVVLKTGSHTEYGKIAQSLANKEPETEFQLGLKKFGNLIMHVTTVLVIFVFLTNLLFNRPFLDSFLFAVALAVGLIPELLPMIVSVNLATGALLMSKKGVIVKRMASIQNIGSMDVLCSDKTGTLTENKIELIFHINIEGKDDEKVLLYSLLNSFHQTGLKSPLDDAILEHSTHEMENYRKIDEIPFDFVRKRVSVVVGHTKEKIILSKGAPEEIMKICSLCKHKGKIAKLSSELLKKIEQKFYDLSTQGFRVLAVSYKNTKKSKYTVKDEQDMVFLGFVVFRDPPKKTAKESIKRLQDKGVELKILTGDNELVTKKLCKEIDFEIKRVILGSEISQMHDDALAILVEKANLFVRVTPTQKERIIAALRKNGHVVGFIGDGINDATSLKTADVGISVDNAVDVAKESADIILSRKSLNVLHDGVVEGRKTFGNIMKYIMMGTSSNFGNMFSVAGASLFLPFLPMLPLQILLNNFLYDFSEITIPTDEVDSDYIEKPKKWNIGFIKKFMIFMGPISSLFDFLCFFILLFLFHANASLFQTGWFIESLCTQTLVIFVIRTKKTPFYKSKASKPLLLSSLIILCLGLLIPFTPFGKLFKFAQPPFTFYIALVGMIAAYLAITELAKKQFYKRNAM